MRGVALVLAAVITVGYGYTVQAAIAADLAEALERGRAAELVEQERVWYGGTLAPVTIQAAPETPKARAA